MRATYALFQKRAQLSEEDLLRIVATHWDDMDAAKQVLMEDGPPGDIETEIIRTAFYSGIHLGPFLYELAQREPGIYKDAYRQGSSLIHVLALLLGIKAIDEPDGGKTYVAPPYPDQIGGWSPPARN